MGLYGNEKCIYNEHVSNPYYLVECHNPEVEDDIVKIVKSGFCNICKKSKMPSFQQRENKTSILSDKDIKNAINHNNIIISPFNKNNLQPASYDLTLGEDFKIIKSNQVISSKEEVKYKSFTSAGYILKPKEFILATTVEKIALSDSIVGELSGKSSWGRRGLMVENAGFIDPGFIGTLTLELFNESNAKIEINIGEPICQIAFKTLTSRVNKIYNGKYQNQKGTTGARKDD